MTNFYHGLWKGPVDRKASSIINVIANDTITMGSAVKFDTENTPDNELLPRIIPTNDNNDTAYGIAVDGDADGIYGDGSESVDNTTLATKKAGDGVAVVTQGRCLARVDTTDVDIGSELRPDSANPGLLQKSTNTASDHVIARALSSGSQIGEDLIPIDVQREGTHVITGQTAMTYSGGSDEMTFSGTGDTMTYSGI